jgi:UDPglucose 6-dehydrogenase
MKVGIIGTGKLGGPVSEAFAEAGNEVFAYDIVAGKNISGASNKEGGTRKYLKTIKSVVQKSAMVFIAVPTPHVIEYGGDKPTTHLEPKDFDYSIVKEVLIEVNMYASKGQKVVLISTVLPGTIREQLLPLIPNCTLFYNPYLIAMGTVKEDFKNPEMIMVGTENGLTVDSPEFKTLIRFYLYCTDIVSEKSENNPKFLDKFVMGTYEEIECVKVFYNTFISSKISFVNMIQDVAERQGNIDVDVVTDALTSASTRIISAAYMRAGMGDGGACHPRDNIALRYLSQKLDLGYDLFESIMGSREVQAKNLAKFLIKIADACRLPIVIHGKAYKPKVPYIDGSYSLLVGHYIEELGEEVNYVDNYTGDTWRGAPAVFLLAHSVSTTYRYWKEQNTGDETYCDFQFGSVIVDPWRKFVAPEDEPLEVIYYGNTRGKTEYENRRGRLAKQ